MEKTFKEQGKTNRILRDITMKLFEWFSSVFSSINSLDGLSNSSHNMDYNYNHQQTMTNPATGMPMIGSIDIHGNPFGTDNLNSMHNSFAGHNSIHDDFYRNDPFNSIHNPMNDIHNSSLHDSFITNSFDDPFRTW